MLFSHLFSKLFSCILIAKKMRYKYRKIILIEMCFRCSNVLITFYFKKIKYSNNVLFMPSLKKTLHIRMINYPILSQKIYGNCKKYVLISMPIILS